MATVLLVVNNLLALCIAVSTAEIAMKGREPWRRVLAAVAGFPVIVCAVLFALGTAGALSAGAIAALLAPVALVAVFGWRRRMARVDGSVPSGAPADENRTGAFAWSVTMAFFGAYAVLVLARPHLTGAWFSGDDLSYHGPAVAHWVIDGHLSLAPFNYHAYYAFNAELVSLWFVLPFRSDVLTTLAGAYWAALAGLSSVSLGFAMGLKKPSAVLPGLLLLASPVVVRVATRFAAVDLAGPALVLAAVAFAIPSVGSKSSRTDFADALYCGLLSGLAAGCKVSIAPVCVALLCWFVFWRSRHLTGKDRGAVAALFFLGAIVTGAYWYARNIVLTGNPVFPAELGPFDGPFTSAHQNRTKLISWVLKAPLDINQWSFLIRAHVAWPIGLFLPAIAGYVAAVCAVVSKKRSSGERQRAGRGLLLLVGAILLLLYPLMPFSGTDNSADAELRIALRQLIAPCSIGLVLFSPLTDHDTRHRNVFWLLGAIGVLTGWYAVSRVAPFAALLACGLGTLLWRRFRDLLTEVRASRTVSLLLVVIPLGSMGALAPLLQRHVREVIRASGDGRHPVGRAWCAVDALPSGSSIAWFGPGAYQYYPLFGRSLQLVPRAVTSDGSPRPWLHERWRVDPKVVKWWGNEERPELDSLVDNLVYTGVDYVFVTKGDGDDWPAQQAALMKSDGADPVYDDGHSTIWHIAPKEQPTD